ncbi:MAG: ATP-grasp domain-containing protein [Microbacteriaceae bacterium]|jgi:acetyl-CoA/propionyl-CoA carboxylase biotin carboxyl carrier protein|nr:ATP-grasp domain-containing protein [Microbacteriaceae bacterium]MCI1207345.1 ATP-grasp domain-containing protein [Microbacteriaceae bacterium]
MSIHRVLIANRGEIAVRIERACAEYGVESVAVYSDQDAEALHVRNADVAYPLDGTALSDTYLNGDTLLRVAAESGADAIHPGYGFLSENASFARAVREAGLVWIGPSPETIELLGDKISAHALAKRVGAPLVPSSDGSVSSPEEVVDFAREAGLPIVIKATAGGGGMGMRTAHTMAEIPQAFTEARHEAQAAFGNGVCFTERFLEHPRHIEVQVVGDRPGHVVVIGTRDCSLQRRGQKLVEEAPAPFLTPDQVDEVTGAARRICEAAGYTSAGTVEFLLGDDGHFSFMEVNARIQVEHGVTEQTAGIDLVRQQLLVADGRPLDVQETPAPTGHALEFRIIAEDPGRGFVPEPGTVTRVEFPGGPGVRVDSGVQTGSAVPPDYDSLMAKIVVSADDRQAAIRRARRALNELVVEGVGQIVPLYRRLLEDSAFTAPTGRLGISTTWLEAECAWIDSLRPGLGNEEVPEAPLRTWVEVDGVRHRLGVPARVAALLSHPQSLGMPQSPERTDAVATPGAVRAPMPGTLSSWRYPDGALVQEGETVALLEAMKLESPVAAPCTGVLRITRPAGAPCRGGDVLGRVETSAGSESGDIDSGSPIGIQNREGD